MKNKMKGAICIICALGVFGTSHFSVSAADVARTETGEIFNISDIGDGAAIDITAVRLAANATIIADGVRFRRTPSLSGEILGTFYSGQRVWHSYNSMDIVVADGYWWVPVIRLSDGVKGYVAMDYIQPDFQ